MGTEKFVWAEGLGLEGLEAPLGGSRSISMALIVE